MSDWIAHWAQARPDAEALVWNGQRWTWRELEAQVQRWAGLLAGSGVGPGDRLAVVASNRPELVPLFHATGRLGAIWAPLNARLTPGELMPQLAHLGPRRVIADAPLAALLPEALSFQQLEGSRSAALPELTLSPERVRALLFTSGTSGRAKAVELTQSNFDANARISAANLGDDPGQRWLACLPLFHVGGLAMVYRTAQLGAALVLQPRFDAVPVARALLEEGITHLSLVPTGLGRVMDAVGDAQAPPQLRAILVGGGPVTPEQLQRARSRGFRVLQTYGLTEACSQVCTERVDEADGASAGAPLEGLELRVVDPEGRLLPVGVVGDIEVRGPVVMRGYYLDPEATSEAFREGWLRTRDMGSVDALGRLKVAARRTDLIVSGGENIYPAELEAVLALHPSIAEAAVVGIDDREWGQVPVALWSAGEPPTPVPSEALEAWCRARLAGFKVPRKFIRVEALPRTGSGKVDRAQLRSLVSNEGNTR